MKPKHASNEVTRKAIRLGMCLGLVLLIPIYAHPQDEAAAGQLAEQAGNLREALTHYVVALQNVSEGSDDDQRLREKIVVLARKLDPAPVIPEEAKRHVARGTAAIESAGSREDFEHAVTEFKEAVKLAPWWAKLYLNLGMTQEKATLYDDGIRSLKLYLATFPDDPNADEIRQRIYKLEYLSEHKQQEAARAQTEQRARNPKFLEGVWKNKQSGRAYRVAITGDELEARSSTTSDAVVRDGDFIFHGILRGRTIDGTFRFPGYDDVGCTIPTSEMPMSGMVSEDRTSITFHSQRVVYNYSGRYTIFGKKCNGVSRDHVEESITTLVR